MFQAILMSGQGHPALYISTSFSVSNLKDLVYGLYEARRIFNLGQP